MTEASNEFLLKLTTYTQQRKGPIKLTKEGYLDQWYHYHKVKGHNTKKYYNKTLSLYSKG